MKKTYIIITVLAVFAVLPASALQPHGGIDASDITVTRTESSVRLEMKLSVSGDAVSKCQSVAVIPTLTSADGARTADFPYVLVNGKKNRQMFERKNKFGIAELRENPPYKVVNIDKKQRGETIAYSAGMPAPEWEEGAVLKLGMMLVSCGGERQYYAMEVSATRTIQAVQPAPAPVVVVQEAPKQPAVVVEPVKPVQESEKTEHFVGGCAYLDFMPDSYEILPYFKRNAEELAAIRRVLDKVKSNPQAVITELSITGYASPEGRFSNNERLAYDRALSVAKYLQSLYGISVRDSRVGAVAEDWDKLAALVDAGSMPYKKEVKDILDSSDHPDVKESKLRRLADGGPWKYMIDNMFPQLRRVEYKVTYSLAE